MNIRLKKSQFVLSALTDAQPGELGWLFRRNANNPTLVLTVTPPQGGLPGVHFVEFDGPHRNAYRNLAEPNPTQVAFLKVPYEWEIETSMSSSRDLSESGQLLMTPRGTYLTISLNRYRKYLNLSDFTVQDGDPSDVFSYIEDWKIVAGVGSEKIVLVEPIVE